MAAPELEVRAVEPRVLTIDEAARLLRTSRDGIYKLIDEGRLKSVRIGKRHLVPLASVDDWIARETAA